MFLLDVIYASVVRWNYMQVLIKWVNWESCHSYSFKNTPMGGPRTLSQSIQALTQFLYWYRRGLTDLNPMPYWTLRLKQERQLELPFCLPPSLSTRLLFMVLWPLVKSLGPSVPATCLILNQSFAKCATNMTIFWPASALATARDLNHLIPFLHLFSLWHCSVSSSFSAAVGWSSGSKHSSKCVLKSEGYWQISCLLLMRTNSSNCWNDGDENKRCLN